MTRHPSFAGFDELVRKPLEKSDPLSYERVVRALEKAPDHAAPFAWLLSRMVGKRFTPEESRLHWERIIALKTEMERKLEWTVDIQTAAVEYFARRRSVSPDKRMGAPAAIAVLSRPHVPPDAPDYHVARLKEEIQRSKRYKHALSAIMIDAAAETVGLGQQPDDTAVWLARVIERTIRAVDILAHCGGLRFLIILPNTNQREAQELAERVVTNVEQRERNNGRKQAGRLSVAVIQWRPETTASALIAALHSSLRPAGG